jgi:hypothetical protein
MEAEKLMMAKKYFEKAKGKRIGTWMSEMRKQYAIRMHNEGAESKHIKEVVFLRHDQTWHYLNRCKPNPEIEKVVLEHMDEWIEKGLYPISIRVRYAQGYDKMEYVLNEDPSYKAKTSRNINLIMRNKWDKIISSL